MMKAPMRHLEFNKDINGKITVNDGLNGFSINTTKAYTEDELNELLNKAYKMGYGSGHFDGVTSIPNKEKYK